MKEFQSQFSEMENYESPAVARFVPVSVEPQPKEQDNSFCAEGVRIESPDGRLTVCVERMSLSAFSHLLATIKNQR